MIIRYRQFLLYFLLTLFILPLQGHVIQTNSFELLARSCADLNQYDLILFDYDKTLLMARDALLQSCGKRCLTARLRAQDPSLSLQKIENLLSIVLSQRKADVIDPNSLEIIQHLQSCGVKVLVLTALRTGRYGHIPRLEYWRLHELYAHGYDFRSTFPELTFLDFKEFKSRTYPPVFVEGILCSGSVPKGEALNAFFKKTGFRPRRIIFVDNAADHHDSVEKCARRLKIPYLGYHYMGGIKKRKPVNEQIAHFQIRYLIENEEWISDEEVERRIMWRNSAT